MPLFLYKYFCDSIKTRMNNYYTYAYLREDGTPYYIGKGTRGRAFSDRGRPCPTPKDKNRIIFLKQNLTEEEAFKHERYMISVFGRKDLETGILHNRTDGGEGVSGYKHTEERKGKMSQAKIGNKNRSGIKHNEETKRRIGESQTGKKHTEETKRKIAEANKGKSRSFSEEHRKNISEAHKGKPRTPFTEEHRKNISESKKRYWKQRKNNN